jgi:hypothetical protein
LARNCWEREQRKLGKNKYRIGELGWRIITKRTYVSQCWQIPWVTLRSCIGRMIENRPQQHCSQFDRWQRFSCWQEDQLTLSSVFYYLKLAESFC